MESRRYTPWRGNLVGAIALMSGALACFGLVATVPQHGLEVLLAGCALAAAGWALWRNVRARRHGQRLEERAGSRAAQALERAGYEVESGRMTHAGDVDLIVHRGAWAATVEIKSFRLWRVRRQDRGREDRTRQQALRQRDLTGAQNCVVWLPDGRRGWIARLIGLLFPECEPYIVCGSHRALRRRLHKLAQANSLSGV